MRFKCKDLNIATGGTQVITLHHDDAAKMDLFALDRVNARIGNKETIAIVNLAENHHTIPAGHLGVYEEVIAKLKLKPDDVVDVSLATKPESLSYIKAKLDGKRLKDKEMNAIVRDIVDNNLSETEITFFVAACYKYDLTDDEIYYLTKAIAQNGEQLRLKNGPVLDKHCSGGVPGNRTTMIVVPILAAAGYTMPKTSSRAITSPAGTADTMEVLAPVSLNVKRIKEIVEKTKACMVWGGGTGIAGADDKMIRIRNPLSLDPWGLLVSSILAKKKAVGATHLLADLPIGHDTKIRTHREARILRRKFTTIGQRLGISVRVILSDGNQPIGRGLGPLLEARDVLWVLKRDPRAPQDLRKKSLYMASVLFEMLCEEEPKRKALDMLDTGLAYKKMNEIILAQGGKLVHPEDLKLAEHHHHVKSKQEGKVRHINNRIINKICRIAGAPKSKKAGMYLYKHMHDNVDKKETIFTIYAESTERLRQAVAVAKAMNPYTIQ